MRAEVTALWRYPVKSMQGEALDAARRSVRAGSSATAGGPSSTSRPGSRSPAAARRSCCSPHAALVGDDVRITLPDGSVAADDAALSAWLGRPVALDPGRRPISGTFEIGLADDDDADRDPTVEWLQWEGPIGTFHDSTRTQVSIIGAGTRRRLGHAPLPAQRRRSTAPARTTGSARRSRLGDAVVDVSKQIDRCVMTTRPQPGGIERDVDVLRTDQPRPGQQPRHRDAGADAGPVARRRRGRPDLTDPQRRTRHAPARDRCSTRAENDVEGWVRRRGGRGRRCRPTGAAACSSPGPRSDGSAPG